MLLKTIAGNLINLFVGLVESTLGLRFILKLFGANPNNSLVNWLYEMSSVLLEPFRSIFPVRVFQNEYVLEFSTLFAMLVYFILGLLLTWLVTTITVGAVTTKKTKI